MFIPLDEIEGIVFYLKNKVAKLFSKILLFKSSFHKNVSSMNFEFKKKGIH
jgi:hypothetical protein